jgi:putative tricarboxylic transport membrane protein
LSEFLFDLMLAFAGTGFGFISGLLPGVGALIMILITYPLIMDATLFQMILFYLALISAAQFSGSIVATVFGIPGETSSLPAVLEGNKMFNNGVGNFAISNAALGSIVGSFVSVAIIYLLMPHAVYLISNFYNNNIQLAILLATCTSIILLVGQSKINNVIVFSIGFTLALIGHNQVPWFVFADSVIPYTQFPQLLNGLPLFPVIVALYVFPVLYSNAKQFSDFSQVKKYIDKASFLQHIREFSCNIGSAIRGSLVGSLAGLIPHVGTTVASNFSYIIEKKLGLYQNRYNQSGDIRSLVSAETANNSSTIMSMMPLLLIGIPITTSEALLLSMIERNSYILNYSSFIEQGLFQTLVLWFIGINLFCFIFSWPVVQYVNYLSKIRLDYLMVFTGVAVVVLTFYVGWLTMDHWYYITVLVLLLPLGYMLRKTDTLVLVIAFILQDKIFASIDIFYRVNFY